MDWGLYPNFSLDELRCAETHECDMNASFMKILQDIRDVFGKPMPIASGYRSVLHSIEVVKKFKGEHTKGLAVDIRISGAPALDLIYIALVNGISRIGVNQKGSFNDRFVHLGIGDKFFKGFTKSVWTY